MAAAASEDEKECCVCGDAGVFVFVCGRCGKSTCLVCVEQWAQNHPDGRGVRCAACPEVLEYPDVSLEVAKGKMRASEYAGVRRRVERLFLDAAVRGQEALGAMRTPNVVAGRDRRRLKRMNEDLERELGDARAKVRALETRQCEVLRGIRDSERRMRENGGRTNFKTKCPSASCEDGYLNPETWVCMLCDGAACRGCGEAGHEGECEDAARQTFEKMRATTKGCPNCGTPIEKTEGCDYMWCPMCNRAFFWSTGRLVDGVAWVAGWFEHRQRVAEGVADPARARALRGGGDAEREVCAVFEEFSDAFWNSKYKTSGEFARWQAEGRELWRRHREGKEALYREIAGALGVDWWRSVGFQARADKQPQFIAYDERVKAERDAHLALEPANPDGVWTIVRWESVAWMLVHKVPQKLMEFDGTATASSPDFNELWVNYRLHHSGDEGWWRAELGKLMRRQRKNANMSSHWLLLTGVGREMLGDMSAGRVGVLETQILLGHLREFVVEGLRASASKQLKKLTVPNARLTDFDVVRLDEPAAEPAAAVGGGACLSLPPPPPPPPPPSPLARTFRLVKIVRLL
jgi:hypothetical protein